MPTKKGLPAAASIHGPTLAEMSEAERNAHIQEFMRNMIRRHRINVREIINEDQLLLNLQEVSDE